MEKRIAHRKTGKVLAAAAAAAGLAGFGATKADASLIIDVRATGSSNSSATVTSKSVNGDLVAGDVVTFGVFAQVSGTNGVNDELLQIAQGSFTSDFGGLLGNLSNVAVAPFNASGSTNGVPSDFDSDGDLDVGSLGTTASGKFAARSASPTSPPTNLNVNTSEVQIGSLTFTVTGGSGGTSVNFIPRAGATTATWNEDGVATALHPNTGTFAAGTAVTVGVPEPASIGLLGLASVGLLARRRDKKA